MEYQCQSIYYICNWSMTQDSQCAVNGFIFNFYYLYRNNRYASKMKGYRQKTN